MRSPGLGLGVLALVVLGGCALDLQGAGTDAADAATGAADATPDATPGSADAGLDATVTVDAGPDPVMDAGLDAGPLVDAMPRSGTLDVRNGIAGYRGTLDATLFEAMPNGPERDENLIFWDTSSRKIALVRFQFLFGSGMLQIPPGATIRRATLTLRVIDPGAGSPGPVQEVAVDWDERTTWNTFGTAPGVQAADLGVRVADTPTDRDFQSIDVTASLARWSTDPTLDRGWAFVPDNDDGVDCASSEHPESDYRPHLVVDWTIP